MKTCSLAIHCNTNDHTMDYDNMKILFGDFNYNGRLFLKMMAINTAGNTMNSKQETNHPNNINCYLIKLLKKSICTTPEHTPDPQNVS